MAATSGTQGGTSGSVETFSDNTRKSDVRLANMSAAKSVADAVRTSLGPRGMDKMVVGARGEVTITNDGATILAKMQVTQPAARMFVELSKSQDIVAGDGTTSVTVLAGSILGKCMGLVSRGVHPTVISDALQRSAAQAVEVLRGMAIPVELADRDTLIKAASTSLNSKVVSQYSSLLAPIAVDCVLRVQDPARPESVDLRDVQVVKRLGGTVDDTEVVEGLVFDHKASKAAGGPTRVENAKIALIQARRVLSCGERAARGGGRSHAGSFDFHSSPNRVSLLSSACLRPKRTSRTAWWCPTTRRWTAY